MGAEKGENELAPVGVIHGRFQVLHNDHLAYLMAGKARCRHLVVGITNPDPSLTAGEAADPDRDRPSANPLTYYERYQLVQRCLRDAGLASAEFSVVPFPVNRPELIPYYVPTDAVFYLTIYDDWGRAKRERLRELGLRTEVLWERPLEAKGLTSTEIRRRMVDGEPWKGLVPPGAAELLQSWDLVTRLRRLAAG